MGLVPENPFEKLGLGKLLLKYSLFYLLFLHFLIIIIMCHSISDSFYFPEYDVKLQKDFAKRSVLLPKRIFEGLCLLCNEDIRYRLILNSILFLNIFLFCITQTLYAFVEASDIQGFAYVMTTSATSYEVSKCLKRK